MRTCARWMLVAAVATMALSGGVAPGGAASEHFNGYGTSEVNLGGLGAAGDGWAGGWVGGASSGRPFYKPSVQLGLGALGYSNDGNDSGAGDGAAGSGTTAGGPAYNRTFDSPMTGTIWMSVLMAGDGTAGTEEGGHLYVRGGNTNCYIGMRRGTTSPPTPIVSLRAPDNSGLWTDWNYGDPLSEGDANLFLVKIEQSAGADAFSMWVNPDLSGGEAGLGTPVSELTTLDWLPAAGMTGVGLGFYKNTTIVDAIRVSNDADGYNVVLGITDDGAAPIPEPASMLLVLVGACGVLRRRRRS